MLFYISVFIASVAVALVVVYFFHMIAGLFQGAFNTLLPGSRDNHKTYRSRTAKKPVKSIRDKSTPWGWGNRSNSTTVAGQYSASSHAATSGSWSVKAGEGTGGGTKKASGFDSFLKNSTVTRSSAAKTGQSVRTTRKTKRAPWGW